jgi:hypothetical protein
MLKRAILVVAVVGVVEEGAEREVLMIVINKMTKKTKLCKIITNLRRAL